MPKLKSKKTVTNENKTLKDAIKETNKSIKAENKRRRELGKRINDAEIEELIPIKKAVNKGYDGFKLANDFGFFDIVRVVSFDYYSMDDDDLDEHKYHWDRFYRTTAIPLKYLSLNMPVDTTTQVNHINRKLSRTQNPLKRKKLKEERKVLEKGFDDRETRDYFLMFYAETLDGLTNESVHIAASLENKGYVLRLSPIKKLEVFNKFSNAYTNKEMLTENFV